MKREKYSNEIILQMRNFYRSLSEKDRRRYAAVESIKFGYGGITYICKVLGCDQGIVSRGIKELKEELPEKEAISGFLEVAQISCCSDRGVR